MVFVKKSLSLSDIRRIALTRAGACLSTEYKNVETKMLFRCKLGHEFYMIPRVMIYQKSWCPKCCYLSRGR